MREGRNREEEKEGREVKEIWKVIEKCKGNRGEEVEISESAT